MPPLIHLNANDWLLALQLGFLAFQIVLMLKSWKSWRGIRQRGKEMDAAAIVLAREINKWAARNREQES